MESFGRRLRRVGGKLLSVMGGQAKSMKLIPEDLDSATTWISTRRQSRERDELLQGTASVRVSNSANTAEKMQAAIHGSLEESVFVLYPWCPL